MPRVSARKCSQCIFHAKPAPHLDLDLDLRRALRRDCGLSSAGLSTTNCQLHLRNQITQAQLHNWHNPHSSHLVLFQNAKRNLMKCSRQSLGAYPVHSALLLRPQPFANVCNHLPPSVVSILWPCSWGRLHRVASELV